VITKEIKVSSAVLAYNVYVDIRSRTYKGNHVAVKTIMVTAQDDLPKIRKVSVDAGHLGCSLTIPPSDSARKLSSGAWCLTRMS